jgi:PhzF family phenazine biosynthesis protein
MTMPKTSQPKSRPFAQIDAFTDQPFAGNPAAVFVLDGPADAKWMQLVAREMNLAETAFLHRLEESPADFALRWFTPAVEVDLCGHATIASSHWLWEGGVVPATTSLRFHTRSGVLGARRASDGWIELDFPATTPQPANDMDLEPLTQALGARPLHLLRSRFDAFVELDSAVTLRALNPDFTKLKQVNARGVIVTSPSDDARFDFISRFFAPQSGIDEDPVTGSAHCALGPYWSKKLNKSDLIAYQASPRGGVVRVSVRGERVILGGQAVTVFRGELVC